MPKNIEMSVLNSEGSYDVLYPASQTDIIHLSSIIQEYFDYPSSENLDTILLQLLMGEGKKGYKITLLYPDNKPASNLIVDGLQSLKGEEVKTDNNGFCFGVGEDSFTLSVNSPYIDLNDISIELSGERIINSFNLNFTKREELVTVDSSKKIEIYSAKTVDITLVGGGGSGSEAPANGRPLSGSNGFGGGGGYVSTTLNYNLENIKNLNIIIGSGGNAPYQNYYDGNDGGKSSILINENETILEALGGKGGNGDTGGGQGNGQGGGGNSSIHIFNETDLGLAGGGGGGNGYSSSTGPIQLSGGQPFGGKGAGVNYNTSSTRAAESGRGFGGGGGGGVLWNNSVLARSGHAGGVYLRFHHT